VNLGDAARLAGSFLASLGTALILTLVIELAVAFGAFRLRSGRELAVVALVNLATNPALNVLLTLFMALTGSTSLADPATAVLLAALEVLVVCAEWRLIAWALPERKAQALVISLTLNATSLLVGLAILAVR
jgi:hypothetical protein